MEQLDPVLVERYRDPANTPEERATALKALIGQLVTAFEQGYDVFALGPNGVTDILLEAAEETGLRDKLGF